MLQAGLRKQLGKPVLLSGQWDAAYGELRDAASADEKEREATLAMVAASREASGNAKRTRRRCARTSTCRTRRG